MTFSSSLQVPSYVCLCLVVNLSKEILNSVTAFFKSKISVRFFFLVSLCWNSHFGSFIIFPRPLSIFMTTVLNPLPCNSCIFVSLGTVPGDLFYSFDWVIFPCFFMFFITVLIFAHLKKTVNSLSPYRLTSYMKISSPISSARDSGGLSSLFLWMYVLWPCTWRFLVREICWSSFFRSL